MKVWIKQNQDALERNITHEFCLGTEILIEQFERLESTGTISFSVMQGLIGQASQKGLLWRLKDTAHHLFRDDVLCSPYATMLDWSLGYIFHEAIKLCEDARLRQAYVSRVASLSAVWPEGYEDMLEEFGKIEGQTKRSVEYEVARIKKLISLTRRLFCGYFKGKSRHRLLSRYLYENYESVKKVFDEDFSFFIDAIYGQAIQLFYLEAALSYKDAGRIDDAQRAARQAMQVAPEDSEVIFLYRELFDQ